LRLYIVSCISQLVADATCCRGTRATRPYNPGNCSSSSLEVNGVWRSRAVTGSFRPTKDTQAASFV
jgi:hypothetical protein